MEIRRVLTKAFEDEMAMQNFADEDADNDDPDDEELDYEGSGAEAAVMRPLVAISEWKGIFTDNVSLRLDGCSPCL